MMWSMKRDVKGVQFHNHCFFFIQRYIQCYPAVSSANIRPISTPSTRINLNVINKHINNFQTLLMPPGKQYFCDCSQHCKGRRILVHRMTYQWHAPFRQADLDRRLSCDLGNQQDRASTNLNGATTLTITVCSSYKYIYGGASSWYNVYLVNYQ